MKELESATSKVKKHVDQFIAHRERNALPSSLVYRDLYSAIDTLVRIFKKYYAVLAGANINVEISYNEDDLSIFRFPWLK